jgi:stress-induced morphogen
MSSFMILATKQPEFQMVSKKAKINRAQTVYGEKSHLMNKNNNGHKEDNNELTSLQVKIVSERFHEQHRYKCLPTPCFQIQNYIFLPSPF